MEKVIKIKGGKKLKGNVRISGSKNSIVALIPAAILAGGKVTLSNIPELSDVDSLAIILKDLGCSVIYRDDELEIDSTHMVNKPIVHEEVGKLRASYYFMGALLGKYKKVAIKLPGGCDLGRRPIDLHLKGLEALGAKIKHINGCYHIEAPNLKGEKIYLDISSVGATLNIMFAAIYAKGKTIIENAAKEPEIIDIASLLNKMGAKIRGMGTSVIQIEGVEQLHGCYHEVIPDRIEAATYLVLASALGEDVTIENIIPHHLESVISKIQEMGIDLHCGVDSIRVMRDFSKPLAPVSIKTQPYPGFATDIQQPLTALLTQAKGTSKVEETIYLARFKHCAELEKMGAKITTTTPVALIEGATKLKGNVVKATDLRCGACLVIAGLLAQGVTEIHDIYHIKRGYSKIIEKISNLGAIIWEEEI